MKKTIVTDEQRTKIIELSQKGYTNAQIATEVGMKNSTLQFWKRKMRNQGISVVALLGRPKIKTSGIVFIADMERIKKEDVNFNATQREKKTGCPYTKKMIDALLPNQKNIIFKAYSVSYESLEE